MRFAFTDDQLAFRDAVRDLLEKQYPPSSIREDADSVNPSRGIWTALQEMGVLTMMQSEADGGLGADEVSVVLLAEEAGRAGLVHPFVETVLVGAPLLGNRIWLDTAKPGDPPALDHVGRVQTDLGGPNLSNGMNIDVFLLLRDGALHAVRWRGVRLTFPLELDPGRRLARLDPDRPWQADDDTFLLDDPAMIERAFDRGVLGTAAQLVGLGRRMLDMTVAYVIERKQFGVPIGSFQAVKHHLADVALGLEFAAPAVYRAAWSCATDAPTRARDVSMAKVMAGDAANLAGRMALQCHGAIGYTVEYDLHLFMKRAWALSRAWGDAAWHRDRVGRAIGV